MSHVTRMNESFHSEFGKERMELERRMGPGAFLGTAKGAFLL